MEEFLEEIKEEAALCREYIDACDILVAKSEQERLALKIASDCEQTLKALTNEIEKDRWISVNEQMPPEQEEFQKKVSDYVLTVLEAYDSYGITLAKTVNGEWKTSEGIVLDDGLVTYWRPVPKFGQKERRVF